MAVECPHLIFIVRCNRPELLDCVAAQITADEGQLLERSYHVVFVPRQTEQCMQRLQQRNVQANLSAPESREFRDCQGGHQKKGGVIKALGAFANANERAQPCANADKRRCQAL